MPIIREWKEEPKCHNVDCEHFMSSCACNCSGLRAEGVLYDDEDEKWAFMLKNLKCDKRGISKKMFIEIDNFDDLKSCELHFQVRDSNDNWVTKTVWLDPCVVKDAHENQDRKYGVTTTLKVKRHGGPERIGVKELEDPLVVIGESDVAGPTEESVYGWCPVCGRNGASRERRPDGDDQCVVSHSYKSTHRLKDFDVAKKIYDDRMHMLTQEDV